MKLLFLVFCVSFFSFSVWAETEKEIITEMAYCSDCRLDRGKFLELGVESIFVLSDIIQNEQNVYPVGKAIILLSEKYEQFSDDLDPEPPKKPTRRKLLRDQRLKSESWMRKLIHRLPGK